LDPPRTVEKQLW
jgi:hypothetical protein